MLLILSLILMDNSIVDSIVPLGIHLLGLVAAYDSFSWSAGLALVKVVFHLDFMTGIYYSPHGFQSAWSWQGCYFGTNRYAEDRNRVGGFTTGHANH